MKNKLLLVLVSILIAGCADKVDYATALKDPITLNLVKQSIGNFIYGDFHYYKPTDHFYNSCAWYVRLRVIMPDEYRQISCDALDLRLKNQKINISSSGLVGYYMNELAKAQEKAENQRIKDEAAAKQTQIENMANGS